MSPSRGAARISLLFTCATTALAVVGSALPTQAQESGSYAPSRTYYLHTHDPASLQRDVFGSGYFAPEAPDGAAPMTSAGVVQRWPGTPAAGLTYNVTVDLWVQAPRAASFGVQLSTRTEALCLGTMNVPGPGIFRLQGSFTHWYQTNCGKDPTPLAVRFEEGEQIFLFIGGMRGTVNVLLDHPSVASSFTLNDPAVSTGPATPSGSPTPTPTVSESPTTSPSTTPSPSPTGYDYGCAQVERRIDDPLFGCQWGLRQTHVPEAWAQPHASGEGITVAVLDTGLDLEHPDLQCPDKLDLTHFTARSTPDDPTGDDVEGHGTHVAGIVGACADNETGIAGVAPAATLMPIRIIYSSDRAKNLEDDTTTSMADAIVAATDSGAHVINLSVGCIVPGPVCEELPDGVEGAVEYAWEHGVVVVAAAGNDGSFTVAGHDVRQPCLDPAVLEHVICVGATNSRGSMTSYSNSSDKFWADRSPHGVVAPGGEWERSCADTANSILSLYPTEMTWCGGKVIAYRALDGTSMASPHVAGIAALLYDRLDGVRTMHNAERVRSAITSTATDVGDDGHDPIYGWGLVNAERAVLSIPVPRDTALTLVVEGAGSSRQTLVARLVDAVSGHPVEAKTITFTADGAAIGSDDTDAEGVATIEIPPRDRSSKTIYGATFAGDAAFSPSDA